jgi:DNA-binding CsgD family transcriptional regulator
MPPHTQINYPWVSPRLVQEILIGAGRKNATAKNYRLIASLLSYILINPNSLVLTERERTYLFWIVHGKKIEEISVLMKIKEISIYNLVKKIKQKLHCNTMEEAIFISMRFKYFGLNEKSIMGLLYEINSLTE